LSYLPDHDEAEQLTKLFRRLEYIRRKSQKDRLPFLGVDQIHQDGLVLAKLLVGNGEEFYGDFSGLVEVISEAPLGLVSMS
jgi:hypothetical protein